MLEKKASLRHIVPTQDGAVTFFVPALNETYHSRRGALAESQYVFIESGFLWLDAMLPHSRSIQLLEVGLGTGLNAMLTYNAANTQHRKVYYRALEPYPLQPGEVAQLNYPALLKLPRMSNCLQQIHHATSPVQLSSTFTLVREQVTLAEAALPHSAFDLVYYDAFAPNKQPELWTLSALKPVVDSLRPKGVLVTYCAQGVFQRNLRSLGLDVARLPGPLGKKEMVRATKAC